MGKTKGHPSVFEVLGFEDAEEREAVAELNVRVIRAIRERGLSDDKAAILIGCTPERIHELHCADAPLPTLDELCHYLVALGLDVRIAVGPPETSTAHLAVV
jgi:hypothetical protein